MCRCLVASLFFVLIAVALRCVRLRCALSLTPRSLFSLFANTVGSNTQQEYFCRRRSQNAYWRRHGDLCRARFRQQRRRQVCIATGSSIQLNTLHDERVLIVDFNGNIKNFMFAVRWLCLFLLSPTKIYISRLEHTTRSSCLARPAPTSAQYTCDASQSVIDRIAK